MTSNRYGVHPEVECEVQIKRFPDGHPIFPTPFTVKFSFSWSRFLSFLNHTHTLVKFHGSISRPFLFCSIGLNSYTQNVLVLQLYNLSSHRAGPSHCFPLLLSCFPLSIYYTSELACLVPGLGEMGSYLKC